MKFKILEAYYDFQEIGNDFQEAENLQNLLDENLWEISLNILDKIIVRQIDPKNNIIYIYLKTVVPASEEDFFDVEEFAEQIQHFIYNLKKYKNYRVKISSGR